MWDKGFLRCYVRFRWEDGLGLTGKNLAACQSAHALRFSSSRFLLSLHHGPRMCTKHRGSCKW
jgi:hypothetical protein